MNALMKVSNPQSEHKILHMNMARYIFFPPLNFVPSLVAKWSDPKKHGMCIFSYILSHSVSKGSSHFKHIISSILLVIPRPFNEKQCNT